MDTVVLTPEDVRATYRDGVLTIEASGHEVGVTDIRVISLATDLVEPPPFQVQGSISDMMGAFPYRVEASFPTADQLQEITVEGPSGSMLVPVSSLTPH